MTDRPAPMPGDRLTFTWPGETKTGTVVMVHPEPHPAGPVFTVDFADGTCTTSNNESDDWAYAPPRIVGLDLSLTATGVAPHTSPPETITSSLRGAARLAELQRRIVAHVRGVDLVVIEGYAYAKGNSAHQIGELGGVIRLACHHQGIPYVEVAPNVLKKFATGKGNAGKDDMLAAAIRRLEYPGADHNQADALWLRELARHRYQHPERRPLPKAQTAVVNTIDWPDLQEHP